MLVLLLLQSNTALGFYANVANNWRVITCMICFNYANTRRVRTFINTVIPLCMLLS